MKLKNVESQERQSTGESFYGYQLRGILDPAEVWRRDAEEKMARARKLRRVEWILKAAMALWIGMLIYMAIGAF